MSRGLGALQRRICEVLEDAEDDELALRELRRRLGEPDRSNMRRAIRGLLERKIVEELRVGGGRRVRLAPWARAPRDPSSEPPRERAGCQTPAGDPRRVPEEALEVFRRALGAEPVEGHGGSRLRRRTVRKREVGGTQGRVLGALWHYSERQDRGLPVGAVKAMVGGDRSNARRAIRTLLEDGSLAKIEGGKRLRLSPRMVSYFSFVAPERVPPAPVEGERAEEILRAHGGPRPTR